MRRDGTTGGAAREEAGPLHIGEEGPGATQGDASLAYVRRDAGRTAAEIASATGVSRSAVSRRLPELRDRGLLRNGRSRPCAVTRRLSLTWYPAEGVSP